MYDSKSFKEAIESELEIIDSVTRLNDKISYMKRGIYYPQVKKYLEVFPKENILILEHSELKKSHNQTIEKITDFLNIKNEKLKPLELLKSEQNNKSIYLEELTMLDEFYKPYNLMLFELLGKDYNWKLDFNERNQ
ncbi:MAG: sulfotransferase domain-containing protein [Bacteroidia bacterium]|nr:sulfotransferase domain-containing protein [Bacteroidia bacterium]